MSFSAWLMVGLERKTGQLVWAMYVCVRRYVCTVHVHTCYIFGAHVLFIVMYVLRTLYICTEKKKRNFNLHPGPWGLGVSCFSLSVCRM